MTATTVHHVTCHCPACDDLDDHPAAGVVIGLALSAPMWPTLIVVAWRLTR